MSVSVLTGFSVDYGDWTGNVSNIRDYKRVTVPEMEELNKIEDSLNSKISSLQQEVNDLRTRNQVLIEFVKKYALRLEESNVCCLNDIEQLISNSNTKIEKMFRKK